MYKVVTSIEARIAFFGSFVFSMKSLLNLSDKILVVVLSAV